MRLFFALAAAGVAATALFALLVAPPRQLDLVDSVFPGGPPVERVVSGAVFDPATGLRLDVWRPAGGGGARPVIVFFYGGGWAHGERAHYGFAARALAGRGFVVVIPDYRKVPAVRFPAFVEDGARALVWVERNVARYGGDPARLAVAGHSAGAHIAAMLTLDPAYLAQAGASDRLIRGAVGLSGPYDFLPFDSARSIAAMRAWPRPRETQPVTYVRRDAPPMLLVTGTEDDTVKPRNAIILSQRLTAVGAIVGFRAYPGLDHEDVVMALSRPFRTKAPVLDDLVAFLETHLKAKGEGDADTGRRISGSPDG